MDIHTIRLSNEGFLMPSSTRSSALSAHCRPGTTPEKAWRWRSVSSIYKHLWINSVNWLAFDALCGDHGFLPSPESTYNVDERLTIILD